MMKRTACILFFLLAFSIIGSAGTSRLDSLKKLLTQRQDTALVNLYSKLTSQSVNALKYTDAIEYGKKGLQLAENLDYEYGLGEIQNHMGVAYKGSGDYTKALNHLQASEKIFRKLNNPKALSSVYLNMGNLYSALGKLDRSLELYNSALEIGTRIKDTTTMVVSLQNIGIIYHKNLDVDRAEKYYLESLRLRKIRKDYLGMAGLYNNLGIVYLDKEDYVKAKSYYEQYLQVAQEANLTFDIIIAKMNLGELLARTGLFQEGLTLLHEALEKIQEIRNPELERSAYEVLDSVYEEKGDYIKALEYAEKTRQMKDSILNEENTKTLLEMETKFETEKKEQEIQLLTKDKSIKDLLVSNQNNDLYRKNVMIWSSYGALTLFAGIIALVIISIAEKKKSNLRLEEKNKELELQKNILEQKNNLIADSIEYARSIQTALQPSPEDIRTFARGYWSYFTRENVLTTNAWEIFDLKGDSLFAFTQSSMDGVPGAMLSLNSLHRISNLLLEFPDISLYDLHEHLRSEEKRKTILARRSKTTKELEVFGHTLQCFVVREKTREVIPIAHSQEEVHFNIHLREGDLFCVFSNPLAGFDILTLPMMFSSPEKRSKESVEACAAEIFGIQGFPVEKIPMVLVFKLL